VHGKIWVALLVFSVAGCGDVAGPVLPIDDDFSGPDGLIVTEHQQPDGASPWMMTSGSLFRSDGNGWTGVPDAGDAPGATGSAVFRMVSGDRDFRDVDLTVELRIDALGQTVRTPPRDYDGVHIWVRYRSDKELYAVSVDRRDATMVIKKKCPGGESNGGTYHDLTTVVDHAPIPFGRWQRATVSARDRPDGTVEINADRDGRHLRAVDSGVGCPPLTGAGGVGIRGDNAEFRLARIVVHEAQ
jgi:hypothetical protein